MPKLPWAVGAVAAWELGWWALGLRERRVLARRAADAARRRRKPLLTVGLPDHQYPCGSAPGDVVLDLRTGGECANAVRASLDEPLPWPAGHFGAAFVSHVLEHVCDPRAALRGLHRVADEVFVAYPRPWRLVTWLVPGHAWIVFRNDKRPDGLEFVRLRRRCNVPSYLGFRAAQTAGQRRASVR